MCEKYPSQELLQAKIGDLMATDHNLICYKPASFYNYGECHYETHKISGAHPSHLYIPKSVNLKFKLENQALERCK